jgi:hypothetical protein
MKRDQTEIRARIIIDHPVPSVLHSLQSKERGPLDPKRSGSGEALAFDFALRIGPGPKFFGDQVQREGPVRRFVYIRVGQAAGDHASPWSRRMKIDVHDTDPALLDAAMCDGKILELTVEGTAKDGTPACATVKPVGKRVTAA